MTPPCAPRQRPGSPAERGSAMLVVATILTALLAGGGIALYLQLQSTRSTSLTKSGRTSLYCAEAGLAQAHAVFRTQFSQWPILLDGIDDNDPSWYPITGDIDGDGKPDYEVRLRDNDDEVLTDNDPTRDVDSKAFMVSRCLQNPEVPRTVLSLVAMPASGHNYRNQSGGGAGNTGNQN
jgi:hypothetical protein